MRIEINLLPGAPRGRRARKGPALDIKALRAAIEAKFKDVWLSIAIASGAVAAVVVGLLFMTQRAKESSLDEQVRVAVEDSTRNAAVLADRARLEARRDSTLLQLSIIRAIDEDRFIWPHILDEISRALPPVTWLVSLTFEGTPQGTNPAAAYRPPPPDTTKGRRRAVAFVLPRDTVRLRILGQTADLQAFTRFYRDLEASPFLGNVQFSRTETQVLQGREVYSFDLSMMFTRPDSSMIRRVALTPPAPSR